MKNEKITPKKGNRSLNETLPISSLIDVFENYRFDGYGIFQKGDFHACEGGFARIDSDTIIYIYRRAEVMAHVDHSGAIYGMISQDNGDTWEEPYLIYSDQYDERNFVVGNAADGSICIVFDRYNVNENSHVDLYSTKSTDGGLSWTTPQLIDRSGVSSLVPFGRIFIRGNNCYFVNYSNYQSQAHLWESTDNGDSWAIVKVLYDEPNYSLSEPFLIDLPNGASIILVRNQVAEETDVSIWQFSSTDGLDFSLIGATNINAGLGFSAMCPVGAEVIGDDLIVMHTHRYSNQSDINFQAPLRIYIAKWESAMANPNAYVLTHEIPRPNANRYPWYGYPTAIKIGETLRCVVTDRVRADRGEIVNSANEHASLYQFDIYVVSDTRERESLFGGFEKRNVFQNDLDYILTENDSTGFEYNFVTGPDFIWKEGVPNPEEALLGGNARLAALQAFNSIGTGGWPQIPANGGIVIMASSADAGVKWMLGRGASNENQAVLYANTFNSSTSQWSGWEPLALERQIGKQALSTKPSIDKGTIEYIGIADTFSAEGSGAYSIGAGAINSPNPSLSFNILSLKRTNTTWTLLAFPSGGPGYLDAPIYFNARPGSADWKPIAFQNMGESPAKGIQDNSLIKRNVDQENNSWKDSNSVDNPVKSQNTGNSEVDNIDFATADRSDPLFSYNTFFHKNKSGLDTKSFKLERFNSAPKISSDKGEEGEIRITRDYIYVCISENTWVRTELKTW